MDRALENMTIIKVNLKELRIGESVSEARAEEIRSVFGKHYKLDGSDEDGDENGNENGGESESGDDLVVATPPAAGSTSADASSTSTTTTAATDGDGDSDVKVLE